MELTPRIVLYYQTATGGAPCLQWLEGLRDARGRAAIRIRINRLMNGNFLNCKSLGGGLFELKISVGPGYRVYFGEDGDTVVLLKGGDKNTQPQDIAKARQYWSEYNA